MEPSVNIFISWVLIGFWVIFSIITIAKIRTYRQFNSPHNTSFFILGINTIGLFYFYSSFYTELSNWEPFQEIQNFTLFNPWILIFSLPYLIYGLYSIYKGIKKHQVIYIYKDKSLNARKFAIFYLILILLSNISFLIILLLDIEILFFTPLKNFPGLIYIFHNLFVFVLIIYAIAKKRRSISEVSPELIAQRRAQVQSVQSTPIRSTRRTPSSRTSSSSRSQRKSSSTRTSITSKPYRSKTKKGRSKLTTQQKKQILQRIKSMKPKTTMLTLDDFKCIFCFNLPDYPKDKGRGIVLCPICNYPAHADEFKDWLKNSNLCSRCGAELPASYKRNPKIVSVKFYSKVIEYYKKKAKL
jgi:hypothetical protein